MSTENNTSAARLLCSYPCKFSLDCGTDIGLIVFPMFCLDGQLILGLSLYMPHLLFLHDQLFLWSQLVFHRQYTVSIIKTKQK
jgi:hypothetical protein